MLKPIRLSDAWMGKGPNDMRAVDAKPTWQPSRTGWHIGIEHVLAGIKRQLSVRDVVRNTKAG